MATVKIKTRTHPAEADLAAYLSKSLSGKEMARIEEHLASCAECLEAAVAAYDSVRDFTPAAPHKKKDECHEKDQPVPHIGSYRIFPVVHNPPVLYTTTSSYSNFGHKVGGRC